MQGDILKKLRGKKSQQEVATAIDVSLSAYKKYESNERTPRDEVKVRIAKYYETPVQDIFFAQA